GRRGPAKRAGDRPHPETSPSEQRDVFALSERKVPPRQRGELDRRHATPLAEPAHTNRPGHPTRERRLFARQPLGDLHPEPPLHIAPHRRSTPRPHRPPPRHRPHPPRPPSHTPPLKRPGSPGQFPALLTPPPVASPGLRAACNGRDAPRATPGCSAR